MSPAVVPTTMKSISSAVTWARSIACWAARMARSAGPSPSSTMWRSRMPVRWTIHSSEVSTICSSSALVRIRFGAIGADADDLSPVHSRPPSRPSARTASASSAVLMWWFTSLRTQSAATRTAFLIAFTGEAP